MAKTFADHLLNQHEIHLHLDLSVSDPQQKAELINLVDDIFTHHLLDTVLHHLPSKHHQDFIELLKQGLSDPKILDFLKSKIEIDIEHEIRTMAAKIKSEIKADIQKSLK